MTMSSWGDDMPTQQEFLSYAESLLGQKVTVPSNPYGGQCAAYVDHLCRWATGGVYTLSYTNAIDLLSRARANGFEVFYNNGKNQPEPGDIWVARTYSHDFGHTGAFKTTGGQPMTLEQNIDGNADALYNGGWVRLKQRLLYADGTFNYNPQIETQTLIGWFRLPLTKTAENATQEQIKRRKSGMYGSYFFTVKEGDGEFAKGAIYVYNTATNTVTGMHNEAELHEIRELYKKLYGEEMKAETYSTQAPAYRRIFAGLETRTTGYNYDNVTRAAEKAQAEIKNLAYLLKGNDIAKKQTFTANVSLNIRDAASRTGKVIGILKKGETAEIVGSAQSDGYYWISFMKDGKLAYVASKVVGGDTYGLVK